MSDLIVAADRLAEAVRLYFQGAVDAHETGKVNQAQMDAARDQVIAAWRDYLVTRGRSNPLVYRD